MSKLSTYLYKDKVFVIAAIFALISFFVTPPSVSVLGAINYKVLIIMFTLMLAVMGLYETHFFDFVATKLVLLFQKTAWITLVIVWTTFFLAMILTNDAVLLTLVPFAIFVMRHSNQEKHIVSLLILMTIAANMGSALTPMGDPQNIYLYAFYQIPFRSFLGVMFPVTLMGFVLVTLFNFILIPQTRSVLNITAPSVTYHRIFVYIVLLINGFLCVLHLIPEWITLGVTLLLGIFSSKHLFKRVDYPLLLTFVSFFIFTSNIGQSSSMMVLFSRFLNAPSRVYFSGLITSQLISNVPAAVLLSTFTESTFSTPLLLGVNVGAMGSLIGSLASLITFKYIINEYGFLAKKYVIRYTLISLIFMVIMTFVIIFMLL